MHHLSSNSQQIQTNLRRKGARTNRILYFTFVILNIGTTLAGSNRFDLHSIFNTIGNISSRGVTSIRRRCSNGYNIQTTGGIEFIKNLDRRSAFISTFVHNFNSLKKRNYNHQRFFISSNCDPTFFHLQSNKIKSIQNRRQYHYQLKMSQQQEKLLETKHDTNIEDVCKQFMKDGKKSLRVPLSTFLVTGFVGVPIWLTVLVPLTAVYQVGKALLPSNKKTSDEEKILEESTPESFPKPSELVPFQDRKYDVVLLGATGFTGGLAASYLAKTYGAKGAISWALAGRNSQKLDKVKSELLQQIQETSPGINMGNIKIDTIIVDTSAPSTIHNLVKDTKTVITTAGPYNKYGSRVVEFCANYGTSYVDITGETDWVKEMIMKYDDVAQRTGAKIVSFCGHDSIPWDITVNELSKLMKEECKDEMVDVKIYDDLKGGVSGGTIATMLSFIEGEYVPKRFDFDPLMKYPDGSKSTNKSKDNSPQMISKIKVNDNSGVNSQNKDKWLGPFFMSAVNSEVVKRTHALQKEKLLPLTYQEYFLSSDFKEAFVKWFGTVFFFTSLLNPVTAAPMKRFVLPKPGEGPSKKDMQNGYMLLTARGTGTTGKQVESALYFPLDVGYKETARMIVESGLCLALDASALPVHSGGFYSPAVAMGNVLLQRLCRTGCKFAARVVPLKDDGKLQSKL